MCEHPLHNLYEENCPGCNPEGYEKLVGQAPEGTTELPEEPIRQRVGSMGDGYSDTY